MAMRYHGAGDGCPYDLVSGNMAGCPRFEPRVVVDRSDEAIVTCAHVRCAIAEPGPGDGTEASFYARCVLRTGDFEAQRAFVVPLD